MRRRTCVGLGYMLASGPDGTDEADHFTCFHCQKVVFVKPRCDPADMGGLCRVCDKLICPACVAKMQCDPWEKQMERMEARDAALRSYGVR